MRALSTMDVARRPWPGLDVPSQIRFSPGGTHVGFLEAEPGSLVQHLVMVELAGGRRETIGPPGEQVDESSLSREEKLRRERAREMAVGVTSYAWARTRDRLLLPMPDGLWLRDGVDGAWRLLVDAASMPGPMLDPQISDDGELVGFVCEAELHVVRVDGGEPVEVTSGARGTARSHGLAEFVAQEEMGRSHGFWIAPDSRHLAFCAVDESHIPEFRIVHMADEDPGPASQESHRYPFAGRRNADVRLGVVDPDQPYLVRWLDLGCTGIGDDRYLARVDWVDPHTLAVQVEDRAQARLDLIAFDTSSGEGRLLLSETSPVWINLHDLFRPLSDGGFLWATERTGYRHLERRARDGSLVATLTEGDWVVTDVSAVADGSVFFTATEASVLERHLYRVALDGGPIERITASGGVHQVVIDASGSWAVDTWSSASNPPRTTLSAVSQLAAAEGAGRVLWDARSKGSELLAELSPPEFRTVRADDGSELHATIYRPDGEGPFPTVVSCYGGPHVQLVTDSWSVTASMRNQYLRQQGFLVAVVDNRGSANRGLAFEGALRHRMGTVEVDDQVALVQHLVAEGLAAPGRVGIQGWSYGGYLSAMCLARRPDVFLAACAGAPVTSWDGYDTHYTERYMGTPQDVPDGYRDGSVVAHLEGLRGRHLLLVHGLIDENVHFRHTARLVDALVRADIDHRVMLYPGERHSPRREEDRASMERSLASFFASALEG